MDSKKVERLLNMIQEDSHLDPQYIAAQLEVDEETIKATIKQLEQDGVIARYHTMISWDAIEHGHVSAMVEVTVKLNQGISYQEVAELMYRYEEVETLHLMSGSYDFMLLTKPATMKEISAFVNQIAAIDEVTNTVTHILMNRYKEHGVVYDENAQIGNRLVVSQ